MIRKKETGMTNGEKIKEIFPCMTKQMLAERLNIFEWWNTEYKEPTTKNDLGVDCNNCNNNLYKGDGITYCATGDGMCHFESKTEDYISRDAVKYYIQAHIHEIITESGIDKNAHTNGVLRSLLNGVDTMPSVTPQEPTTKNDLRVDCISRKALYSALYERFHDEDASNITDVKLGVIRDFVKNFPSITPQEPIIDKIRAEIKSLKRFEIRGEITPLVNVDRVLEIIDKVESGVEDGNKYESI